MSDKKSTLEELISTLKQQKDELEVKMHLASEEGKAEWNKVTDKFQKFLDDSEPVKKAMGESTEQVAASLKLVGEELLKSFKRIRDSL